MKIKVIIFILTRLFLRTVHAQELLPINRNNPERVEWFRDLGLGMFIHWSFDVQVGSVISHTMVGAINFEGVYPDKGKGVEAYIQTYRNL